MKHAVEVFVAALLTVGIGVAVERPRELSKKEVKQLLEKAQGPKDHLKLAAHYEAKARQYEADAAEHADMAKMYRTQPTASESKRPMSPDTAAHCDFVAESLRKAANESRAIAAEHERMAK